LDLHLLLWTPTTGNRRLTEVKETNAQGVVVLDEQFVYDVNDHLIGEAVNGVPQRWTVYDGSTPYLDLTGAGQVSERYLADPNALAQYWARVGVTGQADWMVTDLLGSVRELVSASGSVEDQIAYDAYGNVVSETNAAAGGRIKYAGGQYDGGLGLTLFGARWYNSAAGRWLSQDPLGLGPDSNPYRYVDNGPTDGTDPSGLLEWYDFIPFAPLITLPAAAVHYWSEEARGSQLDTRRDEILGRHRDILRLPRQLGPYSYSALTSATYSPSFSDSAARAGRISRPLARLGVEWTAAGGMFVGGSIIARNGIRISGFTAHGVDRAIGDAASHAGTTPAAIIDALRNPTSIRSGIDPLGRPFQVFIGRHARVIVNPQTGRIVSVNPLSRAGAH
jgi:RHS repeat-associated protein